MPYDFNDPKYWFDRAEEMRARADLMQDPGNKEIMLGIADDYERVAQRACGGLRLIVIIEELTTMGRRFYALARTTSDPVTKERLIALGDSYLGQADQLKRERTVTQSVCPTSVKRNVRMSG